MNNKEIVLKSFNEELEKNAVGFGGAVAKAVVGAPIRGLEAAQALGRGIQHFPGEFRETAGKMWQKHERMRAPNLGFKGQPAASGGAAPSAGVRAMVGQPQENVMTVRGGVHSVQSANQPIKGKIVASSAAQPKQGYPAQVLNKEPSYTGYENPFVATPSGGQGVPARVAGAPAQGIPAQVAGGAGDVYIQPSGTMRRGGKDIDIATERMRKYRSFQQIGASKSGWRNVGLGALGAAGLGAGILGAGTLWGGLTMEPGMENYQSGAMPAAATPAY